MPTLLDLSSQLVGEVPGLPRLFAKKYINKAFQEIKQDRLWSWNINEGIILTPGAFSDGLVTTTQFSNIVTFDSTAQAGILPLLLANPPFIKRQFRTGGSGGPIYNILGYDPSTGNATLDRIYGEASAGGMMFSVYRCYYDPPSTDGITPNNDFLRFLSILNTNQGYTISGRRLYMTREELNRRDPLRGAQGNPYYAIPYKPTPNGTLGTGMQSPTAGQMQYELWPHPTFQQSLLCQYERLHVDLQDMDYFPAQCPDTLVTYRAQEYVYRWAMQNAGRIPELRGVDWRFALSEVQKKYAFELAGAKRQDNEIMLTVVKPGASGIYDFFGPIDSNFYQSHGLPEL